MPADGPRPSRRRSRGSRGLAGSTPPPRPRSSRPCNGRSRRIGRWSSRRSPRRCRPPSRPRRRHPRRRTPNPSRPRRAAFPKRRRRRRAIPATQRRHTRWPDRWRLGRRRFEPQRPPRPARLSPPHPCRQRPPRPPSRWTNRPPRQGRPRSRPVPWPPTPSRSNRGPRFGCRMPASRRGSAAGATSNGLPASVSRPARR